MLPELYILPIRILEDEPLFILWPINSPGLCYGFRVIVELKREEYASFLASEQES